MTHSFWHEYGMLLSACHGAVFHYRQGAVIAVDRPTAPVHFAGAP